jgi:arylsulfatase A-like enzyme
MNFQSVSTAEKLPTSDGKTGGYTQNGTVPGPLVQSALGFVDTSLGKMLTQLNKDGLAKSTTVIVSAKHGQSPTNGAALTRIDDGVILDGLNAAWAKNHPKAPALVAGASDDDGMLLWLSDRSSAATSFARNYLAHYNGSGTGKDGQAAATGISGAAKAYTSAGLDPKRIYAGAAAAKFIGVPVGDPRVPDLIGIAQYGTVFTGGTSKIAEHGGDATQDRNVPLVVSGAGARHGSSAKPVETTQIAPTILALLGLSPNSLQAVQIEHTAQLPIG